MSVPFSGHLYPLLELIQPLLEDERYHVRVFTGPKKIPLLEQKGIEAIPLLPDQPTIMEEIANTDSPVKSNGGAMLAQLKQNLTIIPPIMDQLREAFRENQTDLIIADFIAAPAGIVANEQNLPWITTNPTPFAMETKKGVPSYLGGWQPRPSIWGRLRNFFGRKTVRVFKRTVVWLLRKELRQLNFTLYNQKGEEAIYSPYSILGLGMKELEFNDDFPEQFQFAGPCSTPLEEDVLIQFPEGEWRKKVFITMGTHLKWIKNELEEEIMALSESYPEYLFILSDGESHRRHEQAVKKKENVWQYPYIPYSPYIQVFDLVIHHGGAGILYQCIYHEKPALILPQDYDQFDYAARAEVAKIAVVVKRMEHNQLKEAFSYAIHKEEWPELKKMNHALSSYHPQACLIKEVKRLIGIKDRRKEQDK